MMDTYIFTWTFDETCEIRIFNNGEREKFWIEIGRAAAGYLIFFYLLFACSLKNITIFYIVFK